MRTRAILAAAAALILVSGCGDSAPADRDPVSGALDEAAARLKDTTFTFAYSDGGSMTIEGSYDPARRQGEYTSTQTWVEPGMDDKHQNRFIVVSRLVAGERYETGWFTMRFGEKRPEPASPTSWCRTRLPADGNPYLEKSYDPAEIPQTLRAATEVRRQGDGGIFTGRVDAARVSPPRPFATPESQGPLPVKTVPFEAAVDGDGRLIRYSVDRSELLGSAPSAKLDFRYSAFGVRVDVTAPPATETKAC